MTVKPKNTGKKQPENSKLTDEEIDILIEKLTPAEKRLLDTQLARMEARHKAPRVKIDHTPGEPVYMDSIGENRTLSAVTLLNTFGTTSFDFQQRVLNEILDTACRGDNSTPFQESDVNGALAAMHGIAPRDETEGMLAAQMVATHSAAMRMLRQLKGSGSIIQQDSNANLAIKLLRTYTMQMEALQRYRGKGQQKMTVEHVHVHAGGQAIVGNVSRPEGGGVTKKREEQPHAKQIDYAPMPTMPSPDTQRQPVPLARDA